MLDFSNSNKQCDITQAQKFISPKSILKKFKLNKNYFESNLSQYDLILPLKQIRLGFDEKINKSPYQIYESLFHIKDLDICIEYIKSRYPQMIDSLNLLFKPNNPICWCNMFIAKQWLFKEYCEFLFSVLFNIQKQIPYSNYDKYQARVFGFLGELLLNVYVDYAIKTHKIKLKHLPIITFKFYNIFSVKNDTKYKRYYFLGINFYKKGNKK